MKKSTIISSCLVNSNMIKRLEDAEHRVQEVFAQEFPDSDFYQWNQNIEERTATLIIKQVGRASRINVRKFIEDLWESAQEAP